MTRGEQPARFAGGSFTFPHTASSQMSTKTHCDVNQTKERQRRGGEKIKVLISCDFGALSGAGSGERDVKELRGESDGQTRRKEHNKLNL